MERITQTPLMHFVH